MLEQQADANSDVVSKAEDNRERAVSLLQEKLDRAALLEEEAREVAESMKARMVAVRTRFVQMWKNLPLSQSMRAWSSVCVGSKTRRRKLGQVVQQWRQRVKKL